MLKPVVQKAMATLTARINTSTGLNDPSDQAAAESLLEKLRTAGERFEPEELAAWASLNGWTPKGVAQIRRLAGDVLSGRESSHPHPVWDPDIIDQLRGEGGVERQP